MTQATDQQLKDIRSLIHSFCDTAQRAAYIAEELTLFHKQLTEIDGANASR